jgi:hypothetical protein
MSAAAPALLRGVSRMLTVFSGSVIGIDRSGDLTEVAKRRADDVIE